MEKQEVDLSSLKVNVIMATYNGEKYIREQLDSIINGVHKNILISICDDGSTDQTISIVNEYISNYPNQIFLHQNKENIGITRNFLEAIQRNECPYFCFCDQDDVWKRGKIINSLMRMKGMEEKFGEDIPIVVFTDTIAVDSQLKELRESHGAGKLDVHKKDLAHMLMENKLQGCTMMMNREIQKKLASLPKNAKLHDHWIALIAAAFGKTSYIKEPTLYYRQHESNVVGSYDFKRYVWKRMSSLSQQKESILVLERQAEEFLDLYMDELGGREQKIIREFVELPNKNWMDRRICLYRNGYLKTGIIRNIGLFFII